ncbi:hypothetical protein [Cellulomonas wangsupingiae]|uniref:hypothetical protein n=1 Tax=Cellulomonas wangsupingiae TaxID=2968085 RepID=UPI001D0F025A|nr:hypothetical protein [Cellulomonas wangsupingiae]MCM0640608.1 hypothetical protein [Cellulomonas wangsupingiae]
MASSAPLRSTSRRQSPAPLTAAAVAPAPGPRAGFVLYVSIPDDEPGATAGHRPTTAEIAETADLLRELAQEALPGSDTFTALSLVDGTPGDVRTLGERLTHLRLLGPADDAAPGTPDVLSGSGDAG